MGIPRRKVPTKEGSSIAIVDTSVLVALQDADDRFHPEAVAINFVSDRFLIPIEIWTEFAQLLLRRGPPDRARSYLENIMAGPFQIESVLEPEEMPRVVAKMKDVLAWCAAEKRKPLTVFDVIICWLAQRFHESVLTFDEGIKDVIRAKFFPGARIA